MNIVYTSWGMIKSLFKAIKDSIQYTSPLTERVFLYLTLAVFGFTLWDSETWDLLRTTASHRAVAPQHVWAAAYMIAGLLGIWRLVDQKPRFWPGLLTNLFAFGLLSTSTALLRASTSPFWVLIGFAALNAGWVTLRTGATALDQTRA